MNVLPEFKKSGGVLVKFYFGIVMFPLHLTYNDDENLKISSEYVS